MANFMDYLKNASNEMANIARQQQADQARAQLEAVRQAQREEAERQRAEREAEAARKRAEEEAKVRKAQAEADAKRADAEAKAMKNIKDKFSTAKNWLTSEDYDKNLGGFASDVAKEAGTGINNALKNLTVDAPAVALDAASTNLQNNLQRQYVGAIDEFGQAQYDEVMNPDYTPVKNTNYGDIFRNNPLADLYGAIDESLANDLRGTRVGGFTEGVTQQIPNAIAGNIAGPMASLGLMGTEVFGSSGQQALDQGATPGRAALYGLANAGVELGTEAINPGIPGVNMDAGLMPLVGEGLEELIGGIADPYTEIALGNKNIVDATQEAFSKENLKSALEQGISGALSAGVMNAGQMMLTNPQGVADRVTGNNDYKRAINDINSQLEIAEQAVALNPNDVDAQMQRDNLLASRTMAQRMFATPENLNSDDSVTRNAARQANMDIIEATARTSGANLSPSEVRNIASIANKVGARVEFTSEPINGTDGFQDANGVLQINANAKDPVMTIFAHELTHATQGSRQYQQLHDTLVDMAKSGEISVDKLDGLASNPNLTEQQKYDETVATLAQEVFGNSDAIQNLANRNGSLIDRAIQTAKDFMSGNNSVTKAERAMQRAIKNADTRNLTSSNAYTRGEFPFADAVGETINVKDIGEHRSKLPYAVQEMANKLLKTNGSEEAVAKVLKKNGSQTPNYPDSAEYKRLMPQITEFIQSAKSRGVDSIKYENGQFVEVVNEKKPSKKKAEPVATEKTAEQKEAEKKARIEKFLKEQEALEKRRTSKETKPAFDFDAAVAKAKEENKFKDLGEAHTSTDIDASLSKEAQKSLEKEQREIKKEEEAKQREEKAEKEAEEKAERKGQRADINMLKSQFQYIYGLNNNGKEYKKHDVYASNVMDKINKQLEKAGMTYEELQERMMREAMGSKVAEVDANDPWAEQLENAKEELRFLKEKYNADILDEEINEFTDIDDAIDEIEFLREDSGADELSPDEYDRLFEEYKNVKFPNTTSANEETAVPTEEEPASEPTTPTEQVTPKSNTAEPAIPNDQETFDKVMESEPQYQTVEPPKRNASPKWRDNNKKNVNPRGRFAERAQGRGDFHRVTNKNGESIEVREGVPEHTPLTDEEIYARTIEQAEPTQEATVAEPATETVAPVEQVEESEPISVNDYVTDGDSIAEVIDMEDGQLTLRYENGVTETVDDNGLWNKTETPTQAETQQIKEPQQSESKANVYKVGDKVSVNGNSGQVTAVYSNGAVFVKFDKTDVNGLIVQPNDFDTVFNSKATSPVQEKPVEPEPPVADKPSTEPSPVKAKPAKETEEVVEESKSEATENWSTVKDIKKGTTVYRDGVPYRFDGWGKDELGKTGYRFTDEYGRTTVYSSKAANELLKNGELQARPLISRDDSRIQEIADKYGIKDTNAVYRGLNEIARTGTSQELWNSFNGGSYEEHLKAMNDIANKIGVPDNEFSKIISQNAKPKTKPVVEKAKSGEVKVNEESITKESENITSENPEVKQQAKEDVKEAVKATIDPKNTHSEAVAQEVADTLEQASTAVNEVNQQWEEDVKKATVTTGEKGITKEKTVSKVMPKEAAEEYELKKEAGGPIAEYEKVSKIEYIRAGEKALEGKDLRACAQAYIDTPTNRNSVAATQQQATGLAIATHLGMEYENIKEANNIKVNKKGQYTINGKELSKDSPVYKQLADLDLTIQQVMAKERSVITNAAQAMAMQRWMTAQDPVQKANSIDKAIDMLNAEIKKKFGNDTDKLIKNLSQEERTRLAEASNEEYDKVLEEIMKRVGEAIPLTWKDRRRSWRYTMMLFNPTTIIRNWGGNVLQQGMHAGKNQIAYLLEKALADKYHLTEEQRHHTRADGTKARKNAQTEAIARAYYKNMGIKKLTQSKYLSKSGILNYKRSFNNGILQGMSDVVDWAMNNDKFGDEAFTSGRFVDELARQIDSEGYKVDKDGKTLVKDGKKLDSFDQEEALRRMSTRAYQQALESTYHDFNSFAQWLNTLEDSNKIAGIMVGGVVPFKSTPLNIMRRIGEYSPVGLANAVINNRSEVIKGNMSADTYIDNLAKGLTGTAIMGVGALLSSLGYLKASDKDPDELKAYKQDIGLTSEYALHFTGENGKNYWYTVDWAGPVASVMLSGAEAYEVISDIKKNADSGQDIFGDDAVASALDITFGLLAPVFATTMLQNVEETFESYKYGGMTNTLEQMLLNYLGQYTPTMGAKINNVIDDTKRSASGRNPLERFWRGQVKKIPGLDSAYNMVKGEHLLEPSINVKGEEEKNVGNSVFARTMYNFLSPGNLSVDTSTEADRELLKLYEQTGDSNVIPESYSNFKLDDTKYKFTAKERTEMNKYIGQNYMKEWEAFQKSATYKQAGNDADGRDYKTSITEKVKTHVINNAKEKYFNRIGLSVLGKTDKIVNQMKDYGADNWQAYTMLSTESDKDSEGKTINNSKALKIRAQMENAGIYDKVIKDINSGKYEPSDFGLNKTVVGLDAASFAERYMYLDQIENADDLEAYNNLFKKKKTSGKSSGTSSKSAKAEADAALKLYEKILKGEISATKSAMNKIKTSLDNLDIDSYDQIMNKHKKKMNELELYGM